MADFKDRLRFALAHGDMRPIDLAEKTGINKGTISLYLNGKQTAQKNNLITLASVLNVNPGWLMGLDVNMSSGEPAEQPPEGKKHCDLLELLFKDDPAFLRKIQSIETDGKLNEPGIDAKLTDEQKATIKSIIKMTYENAVRNGNKSTTGNPSNNGSGVRLTPFLFA